MNYFKAAEDLLRSVPTLERALENLRKRERRLLDSGAPRTSGINYEKSYAGAHFANDTLNELLELTECEKNIAATESELSEVRDVIGQLDTEQARLVRLWYIDRYTKERIMEEMHIESPTTVYNLRNRAVAEFALLYYGAAALPSI